MKTTIRGLRRLIHESLKDEDSVLGVKNADVSVKSGSTLANKIEPELIDMTKISYAPVGGHPKINNVGDLSSQYSDWYVADVDADPEPDLYVAGSQKFDGIKLGSMATDGSLEAKVWLNKLQKQLYTNGWWAEVSDAPAHIALNKLGIVPVEDEHKVRSLLGDKEIVWHGEHPEGKFAGTKGWYSRNIGGKQHAKIIIGDV